MASHIAGRFVLLLDLVAFGILIRMYLWLERYRLGFNAIIATFYVFIYSSMCHSAIKVG